MNRKTKDQGSRLQGVHETGVDWKSRTVWIVGELSAEKSYQYVPSIRLMDETPGPIRVVIMSNGGEESGGFALFDTLRSLRNPVITVGFGHVYSIAALIFQAGDRRLLASNCEIMMHNGSIHLEGGDTDTDLLERIAAEAVRNNGRYHRAIADRAGVDLQKMAEWCKKERYFSAQEAVAEGLADQVVASWKDMR